MADEQTSLTVHVRHVEAGEHVLAATFLGEEPALALTGGVMLIGEPGAQRHLDATGSPDGRFIVTSMQENALHGWRLVDSRNMRMTGYPGKTRSMSWSSEGHWLATSGADACVVWPFKDKDGPMGKPPRECGV